MAEAPSSPLEYALAYAREGFAAFPCRPRGKEPITKHGFKDATCDEAQIRKWWTRWPDANIGIATGARSGLIVVDIDSIDGATLLAELTQRFGQLTPTHCVVTGKGRHYYFKLPAGCGSIPSSAKGGLDFRADDGYVIAPPSIHPDGKVYQWDTESSPNEMALAPEWLLDFARNRNVDAAALRRELPNVACDAPVRFDNEWPSVIFALSVLRDEADCRDRWLRYGAAIYDASGGNENGFIVWSRWSLQSVKYGGEDDQRRHWESFGRDYDGPRSTLRTIYFDADNRDKSWRQRVANARPIIRVAGGDLAREADEAERALIGAGLPIFVRAGALVSPVCEEAPAAKDRKTTIARLRKLTVDGIIDLLSRYADFQRYDARAKKWVSIDPPERVAKIILSREGAGKFPQVSGIITTPTLRPDGSVLAEPGYDASTRLYLALDPQFTMPLITAAPTPADAIEALSLLRDLLSGFPFLSPIDCAVALSGIMTAVLRGAVSVAPMHVFRAHTPGTGKSLLVDVAATIATGRRCPVIAAGKTEEETEKRLGALLRDGVSVVSIDNVSGELGGDALAQMTERPLVRVRILGKSEAPEFECKASIFATGNNLILVGDMVRRAVICTLDAGVERPELREFKFDPMDRVLQNRGSYVAACLTIARAYNAAGVCRPLGSYDEWSDAVRAPLIWLGEADPVDSMETAREEDPELMSIRELFAQLPSHFPDREWTTADLIKIACERPLG
jgi:putative DNA primase/helicase